MADRSIELLFSARDGASSVMDSVAAAQDKVNRSVIDSRQSYQESAAAAGSLEQQMIALERQVQQGEIGWGEYAAKVNMAKEALVAQQAQAQSAAYGAVFKNGGIASMEDYAMMVNLFYNETHIRGFLFARIKSRHKFYAMDCLRFMFCIRAGASTLARRERHSLVWATSEQYLVAQPLRTRRLGNPCEYRFRSTRGISWDL
jgi:hypothetical protein